MASPEERYTLVFNGEIFNHLELRLILESRGHRFKSHCDTETLLHAWMEWGLEALPRLRGFFAFAVFDRDTGQLTLARDRMGVKPLYITEQGGALAFASEVRALLAAGLAKRELDPDALASYLAFGAASEPDTILAGVRMLPAGGWLRWTRGRSESGLWWELPSQPARPGLGFDQAVEQLRATLGEAVALRLVADVPVGVFLSGGIDSSVVTALAAGRSSRPVQTFNVAFGDRSFDEDVFARKVAQLFGCEHHEIVLSPDRAAAEMDLAVAALDQPSSDGINTWFVSRATREAGIKVALSGLGGDELFAGYGNFRVVARALSTSRVAPGAPFQLAERILARWGGFQLPSAAAKALALLTAGGDLASLYAVLRVMFTPGQRQVLGGRGDPASRFVTVPATLRALHRGDALDPITAFGALEAANYMRNTLLRDADVMSMAHGLELRLPLLDHEVVQLAMSLPGSVKLRSGVNKALLAATVPELPAEIVNRRKMGFALPFDRWFRGPLRPWIEQRLFEGPLASLGIARPVAVQRLWAGFLRGERYVSHSRVWTLAVLSDWCSRYEITAVAALQREVA